MTVELKVPNIACGACGKAIAKAIQSIDPTAEVQINSKTKKVIVETQASLTDVRDAIAAAGYPAA